MEEFQKSFNSNLSAELKKFAAENWKILPDITGLVDPSPASNIASGLIGLGGFGVALWNLDLGGMGESAIDVAGAAASYIPGVDVAHLMRKLHNLGPAGVRAARLVEKVGSSFDNIADGQAQFMEYMGKDAMIKARADALKKAQEEAMKARKGHPNCKECREDMKGKMQLPQNGGTWKDANGRPLKEAPADGSGTFTFDQPQPLPDGMKGPDGKTTVDSISFKGGEPDFSAYTYPGGRYQLDSMTGSTKQDKPALDALMRSNGAEPPNPRNWVAHHFNDGSVGYVPKSIHDRALGGASHTGGNSLLNSPVF
ncbi:hypothetical protein [Inquilinus sp. Marseille-Q2685]|uniref:hypothetical protein n=1 Tax=Inquilinus sp. Marseille-Q2685 TaxID=2866581 RepID=UPI001CE442B7|nr:hypothetical protein [Inquilinus sp. Marseille-Q2685]